MFLARKLTTNIVLLTGQVHLLYAGDANAQSIPRSSAAAAGVFSLNSLDSKV